MIHLHLAPILQARAISKPFAYLRGKGFTHNAAHRLLNDPIVLNLHYLEQLCVLLNCSPNDILLYTPSADSNLPASHPLQKLKAKPAAGNIISELRSLPPEALEKLWAVIGDLKEGESQNPAL